MATLATQFKDALGNIEPGEDAKNAAEAHKQVSAVLEADERLKALGISCILIGSYSRDVSIRRVTDVDVFARLAQMTRSRRSSRSRPIGRLTPGRNRLYQSLARRKSPRIG